MTTYISPQVAAYYGVQPGQVVDNSITNSSSSGGGGGGSGSSGGGGAPNSTETVAGGVVVRDANGNIIRDTRGIINETSKAQAEAQLTGTPTPAQQITAQQAQSQQNIQAANQLLPTLYAQKEGRAPLSPGQTYQDVLRSINTLETARQAESQYSGVPSSYGYNPEATNRYYETKAAETARVNPVLAQQYASGTVYMGGTPATYNDLATPGVALPVKPAYQKAYAPLTLENIRSEARLADQLFIAQQTGYPLAAVKENWFSGENYAAKLGTYSYTGLAETGLSQVKSTGKGFIGGLGYTLTAPTQAPAPNVVYEYVFNPISGLTPEELAAANAGLQPSTGAAPDLTGFKPKNVGTITIIGRVDNKAVVKETQPYDIYVKETPAAQPDKAVSIKSIYSTPNNKYSDIDRRVYAGGAFAEEVQGGIEAGKVNIQSTGIFGKWNYTVPNIGDVKNLSEQTSQALSSYAETQAHNPYIPYYLNPVWLSAEAVAGAAMLPSAIIGLPGFAGKTLNAGYGVGAYTTYFLTDTATGNVNIAYPDKPTASFLGVDWYKPEITPKDMGAEQANDIGLRAKGALTEYYSTATNPSLYATTAGMVAVAPVFKGVYETARRTTGVPELGITVLKEEPKITDVSKLNERGTAVEYIYKVEKEAGALKEGGKLAPGTVIKTAEGYFTVQPGSLPIDQRLAYSPTAPVGSAYGGLFYVRGSDATPIIGLVEEGGFKPYVGSPTFTQPPELAYKGAEAVGGLRAEPKAQAIAEKSIYDYAKAQGNEAGTQIYGAYKYAAKEMYPYYFTPKFTLEEVLKQNPDEFGGILFNFVKANKEDVIGVKGSVAQNIREGEAFRKPGVYAQDLDIKMNEGITQAQKLVDYPEAQAYFKRTGMVPTVIVQADKSIMDFTNPKTGKTYHRVEFSEGGKDAGASAGYKPVKFGDFTNPKYVGFGLEEVPYTREGAGFYTMQLTEQMGRKASAGVEPKSTGKFSGVKGRSIYQEGQPPLFYKDIADATNIARFASLEKARPDIYQKISDVIPLMDKEQQAAALTFIPKEEAAAILKAGGRVATPETPIKATTEASGKTSFTGGVKAEVPKPAATAPAKAPMPDTFNFGIYRKARPKEAPGLGSQATDYTVRVGATGKGDLTAVKEESKKYGVEYKPVNYESGKPYASPSSTYFTPPYASPNYKAPSSPTNYKVASPGKATNYTTPSPNYKAPSSPYKAPASPSNYGMPSPSYPVPTPNYKAPASPTNYRAPPAYKTPPYKTPSSPTTTRTAYRPPPPPPTIVPPFKAVGGKPERMVNIEPETTGIKGGRHSLLADLISVEISRARYGVATSVNPRANPKIFNYEANTFGYVPTAQLIKGGGNKGRNPTPARVLIPKRKGG